MYTRYRLQMPEKRFKSIAIPFFCNGEGHSSSLIRMHVRHILVFIPTQNTDFI